MGTTTVAAAAVVGIATTTDSQTSDVGSIESVSAFANATESLAPVAGVPVSNGGPAELAESVNGDEPRLRERGDRDERGNRHEEHLGLGFAHGMSSGSGDPSPSD